VTSDGSERLTPGSSTIGDRADSHWRESDASPRVRSYVEAVTDAGARLGCSLASVILFGSAATGGFSATASDLDLILVLGHDAARDDRRRLCEEVERLEVLHGFRRQRVRAQNGLERLIDRLTGTVHSFFICTGQDLLSGRVERILGIPPFQALFVDRVVIPSIVGSAVTVLGRRSAPPRAVVADSPLRCPQILPRSVLPGDVGSGRLPCATRCHEVRDGRTQAVCSQLLFLLSRPSSEIGTRDRVFPRANRIQ
jgi:predicted nucleotidyltransferase